MDIFLKNENFKYDSIRNSNSSIVVVVVVHSKKYFDIFCKIYLIKLRQDGCLNFIKFFLKGGILSFKYCLNICFYNSE